MIQNILTQLIKYRNMRNMGYESMYYEFDPIYKEHTLIGNFDDMLLRAQQMEHEYKYKSYPTFPLFYNEGSNLAISSVFLGLDHNMSRKQDGPVLYEALVQFGDKEFIYRFKSYREIEIAHQKLCDVYLKGEKSNLREDFKKFQDGNDSTL